MQTNKIKRQTLSSNEKEWRTTVIFLDLVQAFSEETVGLKMVLQIAQHPIRMTVVDSAAIDWMRNKNRHNRL